MSEKSTILIVDDEATARDTLEVLLLTQGYQLVFASNGPEALNKAAELTPDLILVDVMMPGMDGFELCQHLRADPLLNDVPIIMITALDDRNSRLTALEGGADDFISKPFDSVELRARIRTITRLNRYRRRLQERTQREQAEELVRQQERDLNQMKLEERFKNQFISNVSHEFRTPLSVITLLCGNLDTLYDSLNDAERRELIRDIRKHTRNLNELVGSVLEISQLDSGHVSQDRQPQNLVELLIDEIEKQLPMARQKEQSVQLDGPNTMMVHGNAVQLRQIIRNLINNAIKYTPEHGTITCNWLYFIDQELSEADWPGSANCRKGSWAAFRVVDTGLGIHANDIPYLFDRFYRVNSQSNIPGTGLGLSIAQELIAGHGGQIAVASSADQGSVFAIYLPLLQEETG